MVKCSKTEEIDNIKQEQGEDTLPKEDTNKKDEQDKNEQDKDDKPKED